MHRSFKGIIPLGFNDENIIWINFLRTKRAKRPTHLVLFDLTTLIIVDEEYNYGELHYVIFYRLLLL